MDPCHARWAVDAEEATGDTTTVAEVTNTEDADVDEAVAVAFVAEDAAGVEVTEDVGTFTEEVMVIGDARHRDAEMTTEGGLTDGSEGTRVPNPNVAVERKANQGIRRVKQDVDSRIL